MENWQRIHAGFSDPSAWFSHGGRAILGQDGDISWEADPRPKRAFDDEYHVIELEAFPEEIRGMPGLAGWLEGLQNYAAGLQRELEHLRRQHGADEVGTLWEAMQDRPAEWTMEIPNREIAQLWFGPRVEEASGEVLRLQRTNEQGVESEREVRLHLRLPDDAVFHSYGDAWHITLEARGVDPADDLCELDLDVEELQQLMEQLEGGYPL